MEPTYKTCFKCSRKYTFDRWQQLDLYGFQEFVSNFLELRVCRCRTIISVEHVLHEVKAIAPYKAHTEYTGNRRRF